jgi:antirestriction protein ArdC
MAGQTVKFRNSYELLTERVIEAILANKVVPWRKPWRTDSATQLPSNLATKRPYRGVNVFILSMMAYRSPWWVSFKQAAALGGAVRKGERGTPVIFWTTLERRDDPTEKSVKIPLLRHSTVFNLEQCEGIEVPPLEPLTASPVNPIESCEAIVNGFHDRPTVRGSGNSAFYSITDDLVNVPPRHAFESTEEFYATLFHELVHGTAHPSRLNRKLTSAKALQTADYSKEELIAEMGASLLCARAGIDAVTFDNSVAYLQGWVATLQERPRLIIEAASAAQRAVDYMTRSASNNNGLEFDEMRFRKVRRFYERYAAIDR